MASNQSIALAAAAVVLAGGASIVIGALKGQPQVVATDFGPQIVAQQAKITVLQQQIASDVALQCADAQFAAALVHASCVETVSAGREVAADRLASLVYDQQMAVILQDPVYLADAEAKLSAALGLSDPTKIAPVVSYVVLPVKVQIADASVQQVGVEQKLP